MKKHAYVIIGVIMVLSTASAVSQESTGVSFPLSGEGYIPAWLVAGPFEQPIIGLGGIGQEDVIGAKEKQPVEGETEPTGLAEGGMVAWKPQHIDKNGYLDFHSSMGWVDPGQIPEKIWKSKAGYAVTYIESPIEREVLLLTGSNSRMTVYLNQEDVFSFDQNRNANPDDDTIRLRLQSGRNVLIIQVGNSHQNESIQFFDILKWQWGFYARLVDADNKPPDDIKINLPVIQREPVYRLTSTFFFKEIDDVLKQRYDLVINSPDPARITGSFEIFFRDEELSFPLNDVPFGESRHELYIPALEDKNEAKAVLTLGDNEIAKTIELIPEKRYELHLMLLSHMDIGYTHPQPVVKELQANTLDDVLSLCDEYPDFKWTVETLWQLEQFEQTRPPEKMERLMSYVRQGRISLSPVYANPYTGWVSEEEMIRSFDKAREYHERFGVEFTGAIYNDVPGFSWILPQLLKDMGVTFFVAGLNELFNNYRLQQALPKAFHWKGADGSSVLTYRTEAYNEGQSYGMEKGMQAMQQRMWSRLRKLQAWGYDYEIVLLNSTLGDNGGVPRNQFFAAREWNEKYAYPKIKISNLADFADLFIERYDNDVPTLEGDWMSTWDVQYQGEPARILRQRQTHAQLHAGEIMSTIASVIDRSRVPFSGEINDAYRSLQNFSGHGSGLEYGYGSPADNYITMEHREQYIRDALMISDEVIRRSVDRLARPHESFDGPGIYIFNPLSWKRDAAIEVQFPKEHFNHYRVVDMVTGEPIPSVQDDYTLHFIVRDLPPVGYKIVRLEFVDKPDATVGGFLTYGENFIENEFYRIEIDGTSAIITSIIDKKRNAELIDKKSAYAFNELVVERFQKETGFTPSPANRTDVQIIDQRPARLKIAVNRPDYLIERTEYILHENLDRIDITHSVNLDLLDGTETLEEYGIPFSFALEKPKFSVGILGGYLDPSKDRLPGVDHDIFSIRRDVVIYNHDVTIDWSTIDNRVIRLRKADGGDPVLITNIVNNFPEHWNRHEENKGMWDFRFSMRTRKGNVFADRPGRFGWETTMPPSVRRSWYMNENPAGEFISLSGSNTVLLSKSIRADGDIILRFKNTHPREKESVMVKSDLFRDAAVSQISLAGRVEKLLIDKAHEFTITIKPNEIQTYRIHINKKGE